MRELSKWAAMLSLLATIGLAFICAFSAIIETRNGLEPGLIMGPAMVLTLLGAGFTAAAFAFAADAD